MRQHKRLFVLFRVIGNLLYNECIKYRRFSIMNTDKIYAEQLAADFQNTF